MKFGGNRANGQDRKGGADWVRKTTCGDPVTSENPCPPFSSCYIIAKYDLPDSRQKLPDYSGPVPAFFRIMTSGIWEIEGKDVHPGLLRASVRKGLSGS